MTLPNFWGSFYSCKSSFGCSQMPSTQTIWSLLRTPLTGKTVQKDDQSIALISNFYILANLFLGLCGNLELPKLAFKLKLLIECVQWKVFLKEDKNQRKVFDFLTFFNIQFAQYKIQLTPKGTAHFIKCKQLSEYQHLLLLRDIWWSKF